MAEITINGITVDPLETSTHEAVFMSMAAPAPSDYLLIQTTGPLTRDQRKQLVDEGIELLEYMPTYTYLAHKGAADLAKIKTFDFVIWIGNYLKGFKIHPELLEVGRESVGKLDFMMSAEASRQPVIEKEERHEVDVLVHRGASVDDVAKELVDTVGLDPDSLRISSGKIRVLVEPNQLRQLAHVDRLRHVEPVYKADFSNDVAIKIMTVDTVHANSSSGSGLRGEGQVIAVADSGFDKGSLTDVHPAFGKRVKKLYALGRPDKANDPHGHGTHVAGSILADGRINDSQLITGSAPAAQLVMQSMLDATHGLGGLPANLEDLLRPPYENDAARIHSNSWGLTDSHGAYTANSRELDEFVWNHRDIVVCVAVGNPGRDSNFNGIIDPGSVQAPSTAKNCIAVGASESVRPEQSRTWSEVWPTRFAVPPIRSDQWAYHKDGMAAFSARGPTKDGRIKPDLVAPGTSILSTCSRDVPTPDTLWGKSDDPLFCYLGGTSMATPLVSGCVAVVRQFLIAKQGIDNPSAALVKAILINGAVNLPGQHVPSESGTRPSFAQGFGRVNLARALALNNGHTLIIHDEGDELDGHGDEAGFDVEVPQNANLLEVTLVWTDYPGEHLINDLDLIIQSGGDEAHGNMPAGNQEFDRKNNVEVVVWSNPPQGTAKVVVRAHDVPLHPQSFALVIRIEP